MTSPITASIPTAQEAESDELLARAVKMREYLWNDADECDRTRRLTPDVLARLTEAGMLRLMTPRRLGGYQTDMRTFLAVTTELGRGCCSASWVAGVLNAGNFVVSLFPEQTQDEVWAADPDAKTALVLGRPAGGVEEVEGGVVLNGEWAYASGSLHADWISVLILVGADSGRPAVHFALLPISEVQIKDTWFFTGMRGTGSNTVVADRLFVPRHRLLPYIPVLNGETDGLVSQEHLYRNSLTGLFALGLIGALIGGAGAAFDYVRSAAGSRPVAGSLYRNQAQSPTAQLDLAAAAMEIDAAELLAQRIADTVDQHARAGQNADLLTRARTRMDSTRVTQQCRAAIDLLVTVHGSSAFDESNPLQRIWRDINVGSRHAGFGMGIPEQVYGRALVGGDPREISILI